MSIVWTNSEGKEIEISKMPTNYIENCLSLIDQMIPRLTQKAVRASLELRGVRSELNTKQNQKKEMLRVLSERIDVRPVVKEKKPAKSCDNCDFRVMHNSMLLCTKLGILCASVNYYCAAHEMEEAEEKK